MKRKSVKQRGSGLLGAGKSGCTFSPVPRCADNTVFKEGSVGKLVREDPREELSVGKAIMGLPAASAYFSAPTNFCKPAEPINDPDESKCIHLTDPDEIAEGPLTMLELPYAGITLSLYVSNLPALVANYKRIFIHLLEGAVILHDAGFVHNDIHTDNIMIDKLGVARFIDFGRAFRPSDIRIWADSNLGDKFDPRYVLHAPEIHAWTMLRAGISASEGIAALLSLDKGVGRDYMTLQRRFPLRRPLESVLMEYIQTDPLLELRHLAIRASDKLRAKKIGGDYVRKWGPGFDSWRLGITMFFLWEERMMPWFGFRETSLYRGERTLIFKVLEGLTEYNPNKRFSVKTALRMLDSGNRMAF